jgi:SAM-dependent methyltransferase
MDDYKKTTIDSYDKGALDFAKKFAAVFNLAKESSFDQFVSLLPGKRVLDLGCGSGDHALYLQNLGCAVTAIDLSESMVQLAKEKGVVAEVMDIENLIFSPNSFDGIWSVTSLLHIPKKHIDVVIKKLHGLLASNGILYISLKEGRGERYETDGTTNTKRYFVYWLEEELIKKFEHDFILLESNKFRIKERFFMVFLFKKK